MSNNILLYVFSPFLVDLSSVLNNNHHYPDLISGQSVGTSTFAPSVSLAKAGVSSLLSEIRLFIIFIATLVLLYT